MATAMSGLIEHIRRAVVPEGDGELLDRFVDYRDEGALAALVERHGPMVWGVCRRLLSHHDAEDAFQATFTVLVRKAASVKPRGMVGNWLYGVARQAALQARAAARGKEIQVVQMPDSEAPQDQWADVRPILDEELRRLPDHYRAVIVLCDLEGRTRKEVARQFGCPEGTVASRLTRAREMLAKRLTQRGVALTCGTLAAALSQNMASAVPASVVISTIKAASLCAAGKAAVSLEVAVLAEGVLKTMLLSKLKAAVAVVLVLGFLGAIGFGIAKGQQKEPARKQASEPTIRKGDVPQKGEKPKVEPVVHEKAEPKETIAWGKEVDGLQMGLVADAGNIRQGEKLELTVKLRNVGKVELTVTYSVLRECAPQVTTDTGGRVSVYMPPPLDNYAVPIKRALEPGETITLYKPVVAVGSAAVMRLKGIIRVATPTIFVDPGKHKITYGGMIQSHPKLATGTVGFEVKEPAKPVAKEATAWGKEIDGLQMGLVTDTPTFRQGETIKFAVKLRNVGKAAVKISHGLLQECAPQVTNADGVRVTLAMPPILGIYVVPTERVIKAGETFTLYDPTVAVESEDRARLDGELLVKIPTIFVGLGKYKITFPRMVQSHPKLTTGTVVFEVKKPIPAKTLLEQPEQAGRNFAASPKFDPRILVYLAEPVSGTIEDHNPEGMEIALGVGAKDGVRLGHAFQIQAAGSKDIIGVAKVLELDRGRCIAKIITINKSHAGKSLKGLTTSCASDKNKAAIQTRWGKKVWQTESLENKLIRGLLENSEGTQIHIVQEN